jgi:hypothetical protein
VRAQPAPHLLLLRGRGREEHGDLSEGGTAHSGGNAPHNHVHGLTLVRRDDLFILFANPKVLRLNICQIFENMFLPGRKIQVTFFAVSHY